jgi:geranylgeranyl diphosphate synthase type I
MAGGDRGVSGTATAPACLGRARELVQPALRHAVEGLAPQLRAVIEYHLGFVDRDGRPAIGDGGKAVRPTLAFLSAEAVRARADVAMPGAVAVELVHNFSLLHDDVMDRDLERRHRPTAWALFGVGQAIVTGDALLVLAHQLLLDPPSAERERASVALTRATAQMIAGQAEDLAFESRTDVTVEECLRMCAHKTGALLSFAASVGAILAGADEPAVQALEDFGLHLGLAFQAVDDILGIWGRAEMTGKPVAGDLKTSKKTLPVVAAMASLAETPGSAKEAEQLLRYLADGHLAEEDVMAAVDLVERGEGRERSMALADRELQQALDCLDRVKLDPVARTELAELAAFVTARDF